MKRSAHIIDLIAQAQSHEACAHLRVGLSADKVREAAPSELSSNRGRYEAGLRAVVKALEGIKPRPRTQGPPRCVLYLPGQRLVVTKQQVRAAALHLAQADKLYWEAAYEARGLLTKNRLRQLGGDEQDAYQDGLLTLRIAARRYDIEKGKGRWRRHAISWLMKCARDRAVARSQGSLTYHGYEQRSKAKRLMFDAAAAGVELSLAQVASELRSSPEYIGRILDAGPPCSLDAPLRDEDGEEMSRTYGQAIPDPDQGDAQAEVEARVDLEALLALMPAREAWVLARLAGLWGTAATSEDRIAQELGYPRVAIERLRQRAMRYARGLLTTSRALGRPGVALLRAALQAVDSETPGEDPSACSPEVQALVLLVAPRLVHRAEPAPERRRIEAHPAAAAPRTSSPDRTNSRPLAATA